MNVLWQFYLARAYLCTVLSGAVKTEGVVWSFLFCFCFTRLSLIHSDVPASQITELLQVLVFVVVVFCSLLSCSRCSFEGGLKS